ncbi:MAG TPA: aldehyde dehydrogenase family protein [Candidatus Nanopelagicaceae bacterium]|nr:aldehyde dehydrogenase family protein [Candidatus Nanopelagicaceae bacterium]
MAESEALLFISGQWRLASDGAVRRIQSPHDGSLVAIVPEATGDNALAAIESARSSFDSGAFASWSIAERANLVNRVADLLERDADILASLESADTGKRRIESDYDISDVIAVFRYYAELGATFHDRAVDVGRVEIDSKIVYEPVGVVSLIGPWNYPLLQASWKVAPALIAGCSFILKPSELTPSSAIHLMRLLEEAELPSGVANLILGSGTTVGTVLTSDPRVDMVSFTGGLTTGKKIMKVASETVKKIALELGGKNPNIIFADADLEAAIDNAVTAGFLHSGQVCSAGTRLLVQREIHDEVVLKIVERARAIKVGGPSDPNTQTGPLISEAHRNKVEAYIAAAVAEGAKLLVGGTRPSDPDLSRGWYLTPAVLDDCRTDMACVQDESFGPVITIEIFDDENDAIRLGNDTIYGLSGAVWTGDSERAERVARALRHGTIWVNDYGPYRPEAEWGGFKASGIGRELGPSGLHEYLEAKHIWTNLKPAKSGWFPEPARGAKP